MMLTCKEAEKRQGPSMEAQRRAIFEMHQENSPRAADAPFALTQAKRRELDARFEEFKRGWDEAVRLLFPASTATPMVERTDLAVDLIASLAKERNAYLVALTETQERGKTLIEEARAARSERDAYATAVGAARKVLEEAVGHEVQVASFFDAVDAVLARERSAQGLLKDATKLILDAGSILAGIKAVVEDALGRRVKDEELATEVRKLANAASNGLVCTSPCCRRAADKSPVCPNPVCGNCHMPLSLVAGVGAAPVTP